MSSDAPSIRRTHWQRFKALYLVLLAIAVLLVLFFYRSEEKTVSRPILAIAKPTSGSSLVATLQTNMLRGSRDEAMTFESASDPGTRIEKMEVCVNAPEFTLDPAYGCVPVTVFNRGDISLPPSPVTVHLTPKESSPSFSVDCISLGLLVLVS